LLVIPYSFRVDKVLQLLLAIKIAVMPCFTDVSGDFERFFDSHIEVRTRKGMIADTATNTQTAPSPGR
jgi:hypothetical protein